MIQCRSIALLPHSICRFGVFSAVIGQNVYKWLRNWWWKMRHCYHRRRNRSHLSIHLQHIKSNKRTEHSNDIESRFIDSQISIVMNAAMARTKVEVHHRNIYCCTAHKQTYQNRKKSEKKWIYWPSDWSLLVCASMCDCVDLEIEIFEKEKKNV